MNVSLFQLAHKKGSDFFLPYTSPLYHILFFREEGAFTLDFTEYTFSGNTVLFFAPYQHFCWLGDGNANICSVMFHGDFYCIEYHKKEVACNGLLFNNIYQFPHIGISDKIYAEMIALFEKMEKESRVSKTFSESILKAYLQLLLALCSREKDKILQETTCHVLFNKEMNTIQNLVDTHFLLQRNVSFYASTLALSSSAFTKKTKLIFGKTPSQLIQDRVVLEAKKLLHLTTKPIKEIAAILYFDDEFYFSRYFKKNVGLSPSHYRERVGISVVAK